MSSTADPKPANAFPVWPLTGSLAALACQAGGIIHLCTGRSPELALVYGILLLAAGTVLLALMLELWALRNGRSHAWAFAAPAGPVGIILLLRLAPRGRPEPYGHHAVPVRSGMDRMIALGITAAACVFLAWAGHQWLSIGVPWTWNPSRRTTYECKAFDRLQRIARAEEEFLLTDWDRDGIYAYAQFHVHLWRGIGPDGKPVDTGLISRHLAFSMEEGSAWDGYYYIDLNAYARSEGPGMVLDPQLHWAVAAVPVVSGPAGGLVLIAADAGVFAGERVPAGYYDDFAAGGWEPITSRNDLERLQNNKRSEGK